MSRIVTVVAVFVFLSASLTTSAFGQASDLEKEIQELEEIAENGQVPSKPKRYGLSANVRALAAWHSNPYYRTDDDSADALIFSIDPGITYDLPIGDLIYLGLHGKLNITQVSFFDDPPEGDREDISVVHPFVSARLRYNPAESERLSFVLSDSFQTGNIEDDLDEPRFYLNNAKVQGSYVFGGLIESTIWYGNTWLTQDDEDLLFDFMDNSVGLGATYYISEARAGRRMAVGLDASLGQREFESGEFYNFNPDTGMAEEPSKTNPKDQMYYKVGASFTYPVSPLMTVYAHAGWQHREYDTATGSRDDETDSPYGGLTFSYIPSPSSDLSITLATSYEQTDTLIYDVPEYDQVVFETTDALLNNVEIAYREMQVWRTGVSVDYKAMEDLKLGLSFVYQQEMADSEEDLSAVSGNIDEDETGEGRDLDQRQFTIAIRADKAIPVSDSVNMTIGAGFQFGFAEDSDAEAGEEDLYDFQSVALLAKIGF